MKCYCRGIHCWIGKLCATKFTSFVKCGSVAVLSPTSLSNRVMWQWYTKNTTTSKKRKNNKTTTTVRTTLQGTNISPKNGILKMIFPRWDMLIPWRVIFLFLWISRADVEVPWTYWGKGRRVVFWRLWHSDDFDGFDDFDYKKPTKNGRDLLLKLWWKFRRRWRENVGMGWKNFTWDLGHWSPKKFPLQKGRGRPLYKTLIL